jgi:hypothetical protein
MRDLPWIEDILNIYITQSIKNTFPSRDFPTIFTAVLHIIGFLFIYIGILLPPKYLIFYIVYLLLIYTSYYIFNNRCIMTLFANVDTDMTKTPIYVRMQTANTFIRNLIILSTIFILIPNISPFRIIKNIVLKLEPIP